MKTAKFERIYLDKEAQGAQLTRLILEKLPNVPRTLVHHKQRFLDEAATMPLSQGKRTFWLTVFKGPLLKPCPATKENYTCCRYWTINAQLNCPLDCTYCVLQTFLNFPLITVFVNVRDVLKEIDALLMSQPRRLFRMGTGELTDSLALDPITHLNESLIRHCLPEKMILEIKTKTDLIRHLPKIPKRNIVISWSLNPDEVVKTDELKSATVGARLKAAQAALKKGYRLGFHFDPLLITEGWKEKYQKLIDRLTGAVPEKDVLWISLGSFRYPPNLKAVMDSRFPKTRLTTEEFIKGADGKMRYFRPERTKLYRTIYKMLREKWRGVFIYFCMENQTVWQEVMGFSFENNAALDYAFHKNIARRFPDLNLPAADKKNYREGD